MKEEEKSTAPPATAKARKPSDIFQVFGRDLKEKDKLFFLEPKGEFSSKQSTLYIKVENSWMLEHCPGGPGSPLVGQWLPAGEYRLTFTSHSKALVAVVIDPDPSGGLGQK